MPALAERNVNIQHLQNLHELLAAGVKPTTSKKRKSDGPPSIDPESIDITGIPMDWNANQVRSKIRAYLQSGEMKVGEFQRAIGVNSKGYGEFMKQSGPSKGTGSNTYYGAFEFFKKRELAGVKMPRKKQKIDEVNSTAHAANNTTNDKEKYNVSGVHLDGEAYEGVEIYDTCDDIRNKINAHMRAVDTTNIGFVRQLLETFPNPPTATGNLLTAFLSKNGPTHGADSPIYYAAYVYFEKMRIKDKKPKSKKRQEMEEVWGMKGGMERRKKPQKLWLFPDEKWTIDKHGVDRIY